MEFEKTYDVKGSAAENYEKLKAKLNHYVDSGKLSFIKEVKCDDAALCVRASGAGFKSEIQCKNDAVSIGIDLNFILKAMRGKIEEQLGHMVKKIYG